jgi:hypothetical protein
LLPWYFQAVLADQNAGHVGSFEPAALSVSTRFGTAVVAIIFLATLVMSFSGGGLVTRLIGIVFGLVLVGCWLFSVKGYLIDGKSIIVRHPFWSARYDGARLASENRRPGNDSIRLFASNWVFGHTLGLCYSEKSGRFFSYVTNPEYRLAVDTERGVLVISPCNKEALAAVLVEKLPERT